MTRHARRIRASRPLRYEVTLPDGRIKIVTMDPKATGQDCLEMVCNSVGVLDESDYFGLAYSGTRGEVLWVNSRNRLAKQVPGGRVGEGRLRLAVRFFVQPHMLVLEETRQLFQLEAVQRVRESRLDLGGFPATLEEASGRLDYGCQYHPARDCFRVQRYIGVGPQGVCICRGDRSVMDRYAFPRVQKVTKSGRLVYLTLSDPDGHAKEVGFRLASAKAATGLYRCVTETHSFFRCDTVRSGVSEQKCRDFKTALVSLIFTEVDGCFDPNFAFDVRRTAREVHDCARRRQFRLCSAAGAAPKSTPPPADETVSKDAETMSAAALQLRLESMLQEHTCRLCADQPVSVVFVPCGHVIACSGCAAKLADCPLCRQTIESRQVCHLPS